MRTLVLLFPLLLTACAQQQAVTPNEVPHQATPTLRTPRRNRRHHATPPLLAMSTYRLYRV